MFFTNYFTNHLFIIGTLVLLHYYIIKYFDLYYSG